MYQSCPQKSFLLAVTLSYKSSSWLYVLFPWTLHIHHKLEVCLLTWHRELYSWYTTNFLQDVSTYGPHLCPFFLIVPTSCTIILFCHCHISSHLADYWVPLVFLGYLQDVSTNGPHICPFFLIVTTSCTIILFCHCHISSHLADYWVPLVFLGYSIFSSSKISCFALFPFLASSIMIIFLHGHFVLSIPHHGSLWYKPCYTQKVLDSLRYVNDFGKIQRFYALHLHVYWSF